MKSDPRTEEEAEAPVETGALARLRQSLIALKLELIDSIIGFFQRWRNRVAPPAEEEDSRGHRKDGTARHGEPLTLGNEVATAKPSHRRSVLIVVALVLVSGIAGMTFSYHLLSNAIESEDVVIDYLRDEVAKLEKAETRSANIQAKYLQQIAEGNKALRESQATIDGYEEQVAELRKQLDALTPRPRQEAVSRAAPTWPAYPQKRAAEPEKTGTCVMGAANASADLTRCVDAYNRK